MTHVHVIGAAGRSGIALCRMLHARGVSVVPVVRNPSRLPAQAFGTDVTPRVADLTGPTDLLAAALSGASRIVNTAHARHTAAILRAAPPDAALIGLGSTRKFTRWPDEHGNGVLAGERALLTSGRPGMLLHPTMIYGATGEDNVQRLAKLLRFLPVVPLPGGGHALVQPIHQDDVTRAVVAALDLVDAGTLTKPESLVIAGPDAVPYRAFVAAIAAAAGLRARPIVPLPAGLLMALAPIAARLPRFPRIGRDEIRRLMEDKAFDIAPMRARLHIDPLPLRQGLAQLFA